MKKLKLNIQMFSSTNKTANYDLPQFVGTDKPTWLGDINEAMADIDAGMHENATNISSMASDVATASATASQASQDVAGLTSTVNTLSGNVAAVTTTANNAQQTATSALNTANTANGKADTNASNIATNTSDITTINTKVAGLQGKVLWTNSNVTNSFAGQTVTLSESLANYDSYEILYRQSTVADRVMSTGILPVGHGCFMAFPLSLTQYRGTTETVTGNTITFLDGYHAQADGGWETDNTLVIPRTIIGYKTNTIQ